MLRCGVRNRSCTRPNADRSVAERLGAALARDYSDMVRELPAFHQRELTARGLTSGRILRNSDDGNTMMVTLPEQGDYCLVHSGHTTCAGGYVELLSTLHRRGVRKLIALVPMRCLGQVAMGTELARSLFALPGFTVVNVAVPNPDAAAAVVVDGTG